MTFAKSYCLGYTTRNVPKCDQKLAQGPIFMEGKNIKESDGDTQFEQCTSTYIVTMWQKGV